MDPVTDDDPVPFKWFRVACATRLPCLPVFEPEAEPESLFRTFRVGCRLSRLCLAAVTYWLEVLFDPTADLGLA